MTADWLALAAAAGVAGGLQIVRLWRRANRDLDDAFEDLLDDDGKPDALEFRAA
ncbi:hypothetical protein [Antrihabitans stalactiti]|uniref:hypothetical protein n=1 Tax=Antrihabitans stalactiti TaxID=2584121 RepID=UPI00146E1D60|nr:hypothetical protein [Antrihabitans stalactiti]